MASYTVQGPSGKSYTIQGPDGATADQLGQVILSQNPEERVAATRAQMAAEYNPVNDMGTGQRFLAGIGAGMSHVARGLGQLLPGVGPNQSDVDEAKRLEAPLLATTSGKVGNMAGTAAVLAPVAFIPGANTYAGAAAIGAGTGLLTTEGDIKDRSLGAVGGALGGVAGKGLGDLAGMAATAGKNALQRVAAANASRQAAVQAAQDAGYVLPPTQINPDTKNALLQAWSGPVKTTQAAAQANQGVTNALAAKSVGLPADQPITVAALDGVRKAAGQAYDAVASTGVIKPTPAYEAALDSIAQPFKTAAAGFPNAKPNPVIETIESLKSPEFDASSAIAKVSELRDAADAAFRSGDKTVGKALKASAGAIEDAIDTHLQSIGAPSQLLQGFRDARQTIAKTYDIQKAVKGENINAQVLANIAQKSPGRLSNELADIAQAGAQFPKALAMPREAVSPYSAVDGFGAMMSGGLALHNPMTALGAAAIGARPLVRSAILSDAGQKFAALQPGPTTANALMQLMQSQAVQRGLPLSGALSGSRLLPAYTGQ